MATSTLVVSPADRATQVAAVLDKLADEVPAEFRARLADRLEETALILHERGQSENARRCLGAAAQLREPGASPFLRMLFEKLIKKEEMP